MLAHCSQMLNILFFHSLKSFLQSKGSKICKVFLKQTHLILFLYRERYYKIAKNMQDNVQKIKACKNMYRACKTYKAEKLYKTCGRDKTCKAYKNVNIA